MFAQKEIILNKRSLNAIVDKRHLQDRAFNSAPDSHKLVLSQAVFDNAIQNAFRSYENKESTNYLAKKWLSSVFKDVLVRKTNRRFYDLFHLLVSVFYFNHPFDLEALLTKTIRDFLVGFPSLWTLITTGELQLDNGQKSIENYFVPRFLLYANAQLANSQKYESITQITKRLLKTSINNYFQKFDPSFTISKYENLQNWIDDFEIAKQFSIGLSYKSFFLSKNKNQLLDVSKADFESFFNNEIRLLLDSNSQSALLEAIYYYLFLDFKQLGKIKPVETEFLFNAKALIEKSKELRQSEASYDQFLDTLDIFFPGIETLFQRFRFPLMTNNKYGALFQKTLDDDYLTRLDQTKNNYDFRFQFTYFSRFNDPNEEQKDDFSIQVHDDLKPFEQAANIVKAFKQSIMWNQGYDGLAQWTEKDVVTWINDFNNVHDLLGFVEGSKSKLNNNQLNQKVISTKEWLNFSQTDLAKMDFLTIDSLLPFDFVVEPVIEFTKTSHDGRNNLAELIIKLTNWFDSQIANPTTFYINSLKLKKNLFGSVRIFLKLKQYLKNNDGTKRLFRENDFLVKDSSKILSVSEFISRKIHTRFPRLITYDKWLNSNKMWFNEFVDIHQSIFNQQVVPSFVNDISERTNIDEIHDFVKKIVANLNQHYRNDFVISSEVGFTKPYWPISFRHFSFGFVVTDNELESGSLALDNSFFIQFLDSFVNTIIPETLYSRYLLTTNKKETVEMALLDSLDGSKIVEPEHTEIKTSQIITNDAVFMVGNKLQTLAEIKKQLETLGFQNIQHSNVRSHFYYWLHGNNEPIKYMRKFVTVSYDVVYYDFETRNTRTLEKLLVLTLFDEKKHNFITPQQIQEDYDAITSSLNDTLKQDSELKATMEKLFSELKTDGLWRTNVRPLEYKKIIGQVKKLISEKTQELIDEVKENLNNDLLLPMTQIFKGKIPEDIAIKLNDPEYARVFREILAHRKVLSTDNLQRILQNKQIINLLKNDKGARFTKIMNHYSEVSKSVKYWYFGTGVAFAMIGLLAGATSLKSLRLNQRTKRVKSKFRKSKLIALFSLGASVVTFVTSITLTLLFFIEKGGF